MNRNPEHFDPDRRGFTARLKKFRLQVLRRHTVSVLLRSLLFLPFLTAAALAAARHGVPPSIVAVTAAFVVFAVLWLRKMPRRLDDCARIADLGHDGRSPVVSAWEVCRQDAPGAFGSYIVSCGRLAVPEVPPRRAVSPLPWKSAAGLFMAALALFLTPDGFAAKGTKAGNRPVAAKDSGVTVAVPDGRKAKRPRRDAMKTPHSAGKKNRTWAIPATPGGDAASSAAGNAFGDAAREQGDPTGSDTSGRNAESETRESSAKGISASGAGAADPDGEVEPDADPAASVGEPRLAEDRRSRRRSAVKRRAETPPEGNLLTAFDTQAPAGRDASQKEEHGDKPGDGRGGETGVKKARGTGTALPVIPLPDSVAGRLGGGSDALAEQHFRCSADGGSAAGRGENPGTRAAEPVVKHPGFTSHVRRRLRSASTIPTK